MRSPCLTRLYRYFNREQILVLQYERLIKEPENQLALACRFLGVDDRFRARDYQERINQGVYAIQKPDAEERKRLAAYFRDDVQRVFALCSEMDPSLWPDFVLNGKSNG